MFENISKNEKKKKITKFCDIEIEKPKCYQHKIPISIKTTDINVIVISNKVSFSKKIFKCFIVFEDAKK